MGERMGRPTAVIELSGEERETLERWARRPKSAQALAMRCRIVLAAAEGRYNRDIAVELGVPSGDGGQVARPVRAGTPRRPRGRPAAGPAAQDHRRDGGGGDR